MLLLIFLSLSALNILWMLFTAIVFDLASSSSFSKITYIGIFLVLLWGVSAGYFLLHTGKVI